MDFLKSGQVFLESLVRSRLLERSEGNLSMESCPWGGFWGFFFFFHSKQLQLEK